MHLGEAPDLLASGIANVQVGYHQAQPPWFALVSVRGKPPRAETGGKVLSSGVEAQRDVDTGRETLN